MDFYRCHLHARLDSLTTIVNFAEISSTNIIIEVRHSSYLRNKHNIRANFLLILKADRATFVAPMLGANITRIDHMPGIRK
jgi:hypothetical protein